MTVLNKKGLYLGIQATCENDFRHDDWLVIYRNRFGKFPEENNYEEHLLAHRKMNHLHDFVKKNLDQAYEYFGDVVLKEVEKIFKLDENKIGNYELVRVFYADNIGELSIKSKGESPFYEKSILYLDDGYTN